MTLDVKTVTEMNGTSLAYAGDAVVELFVRTSLLSLGVTDTGRYNELALHFVTARAQSEAYAKIEPELSDGEKEILKRGRNAKLTHRPKNQTQSDYRRATGFEALMGYLYLCKKTERIDELFEKAYISVIDAVKNKSL